MSNRVQYLQLTFLSKIISKFKIKVHFYKTKFRFMNKLLSILVFLIVFVLSPAFVQTTIAQPPPPPPGNEIPIDGGLGFLLVAGAAYAAKKLYKNRNSEEI
jgi:hypothetical protein